MEERRRYPRYDVSFPIECKRTGITRYFYTVTKDLSLGGVKLLSNDFIPKGEVFKSSLNLVKQVFDFQAKIAWCSREKYSDRYLAGVEFINMPNSYKKQYLSFLRKFDA